MHTTSYDGDIHFIHNGDYSGDVIVNIPTQAADTTLHNDGFTSIKIPFKALEYLVASKVSSTLVSQLEEAEDFQDILEVFGFRDKKVDQARFEFIRTLASLDSDWLTRRTTNLQSIIDQAKQLL